MAISAKTSDTPPHTPTAIATELTDFVVVLSLVIAA